MTPEASSAFSEQVPRDGAEHLERYAAHAIALILLGDDRRRCSQAISVFRQFVILSPVLLWDPVFE